jgi:hypothetical protein
MYIHQAMFFIAFNIYVTQFVGFKNLFHLLYQNLFIQ